jgi:hypothetical protein
MKTARSTALLFVAFATLLLGGCATPSSRIRANPAEFARLTPDQQAFVKAGQPGIGFDTEAVKLALGDPDRVSTIQDKDGTDTVWHYASYEADGRPLFTGYYHARRGWWGGAYSYYYLDYPNRYVRDRFRVVFHDGRVSSIMKGDTD